MDLVNVLNKNNKECAKLFIKIIQPTNQNQQMQQLLHAIINALNQFWGLQVENLEQNLVKIPMYTGGHQDPVEQLEVIDKTFKANNIVGQEDYL
ncbi:hypothetical protein F8M41_000626 [Gigaspora margarita]|uniref:Uncharacterized protein n=1 Tax=Gigaspora margarita TaxID=4874 RepID=A0A8H3XI95_GIGMA|nr:hypothetical protein F8M41_000626 [Gigaspora margarita]